MSAGSGGTYCRTAACAYQAATDRALDRIIRVCASR